MLAVPAAPWAAGPPEGKPVSEIRAATVLRAERTPVTLPMHWDEP